MEKEIRQYSIEFRTAPDSPVIEGRAIPFNIASPNREGFRETITPEAVQGVFERSDIFLLYNHDKSKGFLARNNKGKGSLNIDVREDGVYFSFVPGDDNLSLYVKDRIKRGDLDETSWAFDVEKDTWTKAADGVYDRTINQFGKIYDFSIVDNSYYGIQDVVKCSRFAEILEEEKKATEEKMAEIAQEEAQKRAAEEEEKKKHLEEYYKSLMEEFKDVLERDKEAQE